MYIADISLTSSQGMSSFLQDFDLGGTKTLDDNQMMPNSNKLADGVFEFNYRTHQHPNNNDDDFIFDDVNYLGRTSGRSRDSNNAPIE